MLNQLVVRLLSRFHREEGQDLIEYALVTAIISVGVITAISLTTLGTAFDAWIEGIADAIAS